MTADEALAKLRALLGESLCTASVPQLEEILKKLEDESFQSGYDHATDTVGFWYEPKPPWY